MVYVGMAWVEYHVIREQNLSKLTEYDLPSQMYTVIVATSLLSSYISMPTGLIHTVVSTHEDLSTHYFRFSSSYSSSYSVNNLEC